MNSKMKIIKKIDNTLLNLFFQKIKEIKKEEIYIALSGGRSLKEFYLLLEKNSNTLENRYWKKIRFCLVDERIVSPTHKDSNIKQLKELFLDNVIKKGIINSNQVILVNIDDINIAKDYSKKIKKVDITLLGVGEDGHTASLFPNHSSILNNENNFINVINSPKKPLHRISMSKTMIINSYSIFIFFIGKSKKEAFENFKNKKINDIGCPSKIILENKDSIIVKDLN